MIFDYLFYIGYQKAIDDEKDMFHAVIDGLILVLYGYVHFAVAALILLHPLLSFLLATLQDPYYYYVNGFFYVLPFLGGLYLHRYYKKRWDRVIIKYEKLSRTWHKKHNPKLISNAMMITSLTLMVLFIVLAILKNP